MSVIKSTHSILYDGKFNRLSNNAEALRFFFFMSYIYALTLGNWLQWSSFGNEVIKNLIWHPCGLQIYYSVTHGHQKSKVIIKPIPLVYCNESSQRKNSFCE